MKNHHSPYSKVIFTTKMEEIVRIPIQSKEKWQAASKSQERKKEARWSLRKELQIPE